ncbi:MAG: glycosyltransferase family 2 protein [Alphaproteobacteria bacterium]|nr:glycosyltransferase family 2 protein [Alphaproteobacteria bacterium]
MTDKNNAPLITIAFTCFNAADTIKRAVESAQKQTWDNKEILIVDDGSSDNSVEILHNLAAENENVRVVEHEVNKGTATARNTLAQNAKGEFLVYFDDDDVAVPERVEKQWKRLTEYEKAYDTDLVFCYSDRYVMTLDEEIDHIGYGIGRSDPAPSGERVADFILWNTNQTKDDNMGQMGSGTLMVRRAIFDQVGFFDKDFRRSAELELAVRAALKDAHFISVPKPLIYQHKTLTTDKSGKKPLEFAKLICKKHRAYLAKKHLYLAAIAIAYAKFYSNKGLKWIAKLFILFSCILSPQHVLKQKIRSKVKA